jgi:peptidyl-prolyl cis-trans isomerase B (cyclophilin B)
VTLATNCGDIRLRLDGKAAPQTVSSFIFLARKGFFDKSPCSRLTTSGIYVLQCGDPTGTGTGGPGYGFGIENAPRHGDYPTGTVAMARTNSPTSNGSQFFVVYKDTALPTSGGGYSIFGRVTKGLGIVKALASVGVTGGATDGPPAQPISILHMSVKKA